MKKYFLLLTASVLFAACSTQSTPGSQAIAPSTPPLQQSSASQQTSTVPPLGTQQTTSSIIIQNFAFGPATLTVKAGEKIMVTNQDTAKHNVSADDKTSFKTAFLSPGETATFMAPTTPGTYPYHCDMHPNMKGTLIVQ